MSQNVQRQPVTSLLAIASSVLLVAVGAACGGAPADDGARAEAPAKPFVLITVANDREVEVNGNSYGDGEHKGKPAQGAPAGRTLVLVGQPGAPMTPVTIGSASSDSLVLVHVDASTPDSSTILVYGAYGSEMAAMNQGPPPTTQAALLRAVSTRAAVSGWECIWCSGGILACGVEPDCGSGGTGGDSID